MSRPLPPQPGQSPERHSPQSFHRHPNGHNGQFEPPAQQQQQQQQPHHLDDDDDFYPPQPAAFAQQDHPNRFEVDQDDYPQQNGYDQHQQGPPIPQPQAFQGDAPYNGGAQYSDDQHRESQYPADPQYQRTSPVQPSPQTDYRHSTYYDNNNQVMRPPHHQPDDHDVDGFYGAAPRNLADSPPPILPNQFNQQRQQQLSSRHSQYDRRPSNPPSPPPLFDHSHLRPGASASLLSTEKTLEMYRINAKKTNDPEMQFQFAILLLEAIKGAAPLPQVAPSGNPLDIERMAEARENSIKDAVRMLQRLADRGHHEAQYFLADCFANGIGTPRNRQDFDRAYPLFVLAAKHGHADASYRSGTCCENGWGCRREASKAVTFYRKAGALLHPGAMYRLGLIELNGELGQAKKPKEGVKWLKRSAEHATAEFPHALHELALLHEHGIDNVLFQDLEYSAELLAQAAELGYAPSAYRLGECYEYGKMGCPQDPALSIHYYNIAAQQEHRDACFALTAWYLVGSPGVLPQSDTEAFLWAKKAAERALPKAMYAVGYFTEVGIGTVQSVNEALFWYKKAAEAGDKRAAQRLRASGAAGPLPGAPLGDRSTPVGAGRGRGDHGMSGKAKDKDCVIM